jgi:hypothetical protein
VRVAKASLVLLLALAGCGGWVTHESALAPAVATPTIAPGHASTIVVSSYNASSPGSGEVLSFNAFGSGNIAPALSLSGSTSSVRTPLAMALGPSGTLYVLNASAAGVGPFAIQMFNAGWTSTSAPSGSISGGATTFESPTAMTVDPSGNIYVADATTQSILVFAAGANANVAPTRSVGGSLTMFTSPISGLAANGIDDVYVSSGKSVVAFDPSQNGNVAPTLTLTGKDTGLDGPTAMAFLANGTTYIATSKGEGSYPQIEQFSPLEAGDLPPVLEVGGITTQLTAPTAIAFDKAGYMYVANASSCPSEVDVVQAPPAILVFAPGAVGDTPPVAVISGSNTSLGCITGIAVY